MKFEGRLLGRVFLIPACMAIFISFALADYHYASHSGSNTYPYTSWETAADSIQNAINAASPGDTVYVGAGDYDEVLTMIDTLALIGMGWDSTHVFTDSVQTVILVGGYDCLTQGIHFTHFADFTCLRTNTFRNSTVKDCKFNTGPNGVGILSACGHIVIENCYFHGGDGTDDILLCSDIKINNCVFVDNNIAISARSNTVQIYNCIFRDFDSGDDMGISGIGVSEDSFVVANNLFYNIAGTGCFVCGDLEDSRLNNNLFYNFHVWTDEATAVTAGAGPDYSNNSIVNTDIAFFIGGDSLATIQYVNLWNVKTEIDTTIGDHTPIDTIALVRADPMFYEAETHDFHLQAFSPLIDAGNPDILDEDSSRSDIGVFGGPGGSSYEYFDLAPKTPDSLSYRFTGDSLIIFWRLNYEADFQRYIVNRDTFPDFTPWAGNIIAEPETSYLVDEWWEPERTYYYKIAAYDNQNNLSAYSEELAVRASGIEEHDGAEIPRTTAIESNYPNPFNSQTMIVYSVANLGPIPAQINIEIYDITGRRVRELVNERKGVGSHNVIWDGRDDTGHEVSSGIYFARISQWGISFFNKPLKLTLLR